MLDWWGWTELALAVVLVGVVAPVLGLFLRRKWLGSRSRVFDCSLRPANATPGSGWMLGVARYGGDELQWFRVFSVSLRPYRVIDRTHSQVDTTRSPDVLEAGVLDADQRIATLAGADAGVSLAFAPQEFTAFLGWMEGGLPGRRVG